MNINSVIENMAAAMLPKGDDAYSESVRSVFRRGFHDHAPETCKDAQIMTQFVRLVEEIAEFSESAQWEPRSEATKSEIADVLVVLAQLAWLTEMDPAELAPNGTPVGKRNIVLSLGSVARALRKMTTDYSEVHAALIGLARQMHLRANISGFHDIEATMRGKCAADETRGHLHGNSIQKIPKGSH